MIAIVTCIMRSHNFKGATSGLYSEHHVTYVSRDSPLIFHGICIIDTIINLFKGCNDTSHLEHNRVEFIVNIHSAIIPRGHVLSSTILCSLIRLLLCGQSHGPRFARLIMHEYL